MEYGIRIIYDPSNGRILNNILGEMTGGLLKDLRPTSIDFIDLPYGYNGNNFKDAIKFHVDVSKIETNDLLQIIVIDEYIQREKTDKEIIEELENQILLLEDEKVGGGIL